MVGFQFTDRDLLKSEGKTYMIFLIFAIDLEYLATWIRVVYPLRPFPRLKVLGIQCLDKAHEFQDRDLLKSEGKTYM